MINFEFWIINVRFEEFKSIIHHSKSIIYFIEGRIYDW